MSDMELAIRIRVDGKSGQAEIVGLGNALRKSGDAGLDAGRKINSGFTAARQGVQSISNQLASLQRTLVGVASTWVSFQGGKALLEQVATVQDLNTRLKYLTGSAREFGEIQAWLSGLAQRQHKDYLDLASAYSGLLALQKDGNVTQEEARRIMEGLSNAASVMGASNAQLQQVFYGLQQTLSANTINMEDFRQVVDPLPGLFGKVARAAGLTTSEFKDQVAQGEITGEMFRRYLISALEDYAGAAEKNASNIHAKYTDISNAWTRLVQVLEKPVSETVTPVLDAVTAGVDRLNSAISRSRLDELRDDLTALEQAGPKSGGLLGVTLMDRAAFIEERQRLQDSIRREEHNSQRASDRFTGTANIGTGGASLAMLDQQKQKTKELSDAQKMLRKETAATDVEIAKRNQNWTALEDAYTRQIRASGRLSETEARAVAVQKVRGDQDAANERSMHKSATAAEKLSDKLSDLYTKYQDELNVIGMTEREAVGYKAAHEAMAAGAKDAGAAAKELAQRAYDAKDALEKESRAAENVAQAFKNAKLEQDIANQSLGALRELQAQGLTGDALKKAFDERKTYIETKTKDLYDGMTETVADAHAKMVQDAKHTRHQTDETFEKSADSFTETWKNAVKRLDDVFANFWKGLLSGSGDFMGSLKSLLTDFAAEFLHNTFTRPLTNLFSGGGTAAGAPTGIFSLLGNLFGSGNPTSFHDPFGGIGPLLPNSVASSRGIGGGSGLFDILNGGASLSGVFDKLTNFVGFSDAAMNLFKVGGFGFSSSLGNIGLKAANFFGLGAGGTGALAGGFGYSPWGALGSLGASLLGVKGGIGTTIGGALGGFGGGALAGAAASGALGATMAGLAAIPGVGPFLAILGGLGGSFLGSLFGAKPKIPEAFAAQRLSATNMKTLTDSWEKNGGPLDAMVSATDSLLAGIVELENTFDVAFGRAGASAYSKADKGQFAVDLLGKRFQSGKFKLDDEGAFTAMYADMRMWALKQAIDQIDDPALATSIRKRERIGKVKQDMRAIEGIRLFTGEWSSLHKTLEDMSKTFEKMRGSAAFLDMDMRKLHEGYQRAMVAQRDQLQAQTRALLGQETDPETARRARENEARQQYAQIRDYNAAIAEENSDATRNLGELLTDLGRYGKKKPRNDRQRRLAGIYAQAQSLSQIDLNAAGGGDLFNTRALDLADALSGAAQPGAKGRTLRKLGDFAAQMHAADLSLLDDTTSRLSEAQFVELALKQLQKERYDAEMQYLKRIKEYVDSLLLSDLSTLNPDEQLRKAQGDYGSALLKAQAHDVEALANLPNLADQYLRQARSFYASSESYATIFDSVVNALRGLQVPGFAVGGVASGWAMVGEQGPELVNFRSPGRVYTAEETRAALSGGNQGDAAAAASVERLIRVQQEGNRRIIERLNAMDGRLAGLESSARLEALAA